MSSSPDVSAPFITSPIVQVNVGLPLSESVPTVGDAGTVASIWVPLFVAITLTNSNPVGKVSVNTTLSVVPLVKVTTVLYSNS